MSGELEDGTYEGYCSLMIGTTKYKRAVAALINLLSQSKCHTLDRHNLRAQRDPKCCLDAQKSD